MKSPQWKTYRTRFLVKAKQLTTSLSFTDHLGRQHCGRKGDYLVESYEGVLSIAPRHIFEDIYVPMSVRNESSNPPSDEADVVRNAPQTFNHVQVEALEIKKIRDASFRVQFSDPGPNHPPITSRVRRKLPQSFRHTAERMGLM
jgi:hypothetical protein